VSARGDAANFVRVDTDFGSDPIKAEIANAEQAEVHTRLVIGGRDPAWQDRQSFSASAPQRQSRREAKAESVGGHVASPPQSEALNTHFRFPTVCVMNKPCKRPTVPTRLTLTGMVDSKVSSQHPFARPT
jgi:hypothetical protein